MFLSSSHTSSSLFLTTVTIIRFIIFIAILLVFQISAQTIVWPSSDRFIGDKDFVQGEIFIDPVAITESPAKGTVGGKTLLHFKDCTFHRQVFNNKRIVLEENFEEIRFENCTFQNAVAFFHETRKDLAGFTSNIPDESYPFVFAAPSTALTFINCNFSKDLNFPNDQRDAVYNHQVEIRYAVKNAVTVIEKDIAEDETNALKFPSIRFSGCTLYQNRKGEASFLVYVTMSVDSSLFDTNWIEPPHMHEVAFVNNSIEITHGLPIGTEIIGTNDIHHNFIWFNIDQEVCGGTSAIYSKFPDKTVIIDNFNISANRIQFNDEEDENSNINNNKFSPPREYITFFNSYSSDIKHRNAFHIFTLPGKSLRGKFRGSWGPSYTRLDISDNIIDFKQVTTVWNFGMFFIPNFQNASLVTFNRNKVIKAPDAGSNFLYAVQLWSGYSSVSFAIFDCQEMSYRDIERWEVNDNDMTLAWPVIHLLNFDLNKDSRTASSFRFMTFNLSTFTWQRNSILANVYRRVDWFLFRPAFPVVALRHLMISDNKIDINPRLPRGPFRSQSVTANFYLPLTKATRYMPNQSGDETAQVTEENLKNEIVTSARLFFVMQEDDELFQDGSLYGCETVTIRDNHVVNLVAGTFAIVLDMRSGMIIAEDDLASRAEGSTMHRKIQEALPEIHRYIPPKDQLLKNTSLKTQIVLQNNFVDHIEVISTNTIVAQTEEFNDVTLYIAVFSKFFFNVDTILVRNNTIRKAVAGAADVVRFFQLVCAVANNHGREVAVQNLIFEDNTVLSAEKSSQTQRDANFGGLGVSFMTRNYLENLIVRRNFINLTVHDRVPLGGVIAVFITGASSSIFANVTIDENFLSVTEKRVFNDEFRSSGSGLIDFSMAFTPAVLQEAQSNLQMDPNNFDFTKTRELRLLLPNTSNIFSHIRISSNNFVTDGANRASAAVSFSSCGHIHLEHGAVIENNTYTARNTVNASFVVFGSPPGSISSWLGSVGQIEINKWLQIPIVCDYSFIVPTLPNTSFVVRNSTIIGTSIVVFLGSTVTSSSSSGSNTGLSFDLSNIIIRDSQQWASYFNAATLSTTNFFFFASHLIRVATFKMIGKEPWITSHIDFIKISNITYEGIVESLCLSQTIIADQPYGLTTNPTPQRARVDPGILFSSDDLTQIDKSVVFENIAGKISCVFADQEEFDSAMTQLTSAGNGLLRGAYELGLPMAIPLLNISDATKLPQFINLTNINLKFETRTKKQSPLSLIPLHVVSSYGGRSLPPSPSPSSLPRTRLSLASSNNFETLDSERRIDSLFKASSPGSTIPSSSLVVELGCFKWNQKEIDIRSPIVANSDLELIALEGGSLLLEDCSLPSFTPSFSFVETRTDSDPTLSHSNSSTASISVLRMKKPAKPWQVPPAAMGTAFVLTSMMPGAVTSANNLRKVNTIAALRACGNASQIEDLQFDSNPLFVSIGSGVLASYKGAAIGALGVVAIAGLICCIIFGVYFRPLLNAKKEQVIMKKSLKPSLSSSSSPRSSSTSHEDFMKSKNKNTITTVELSSKQVKDLREDALSTLRMPGLIFTVLLIMAYPAVSAAFTVYTFNSEEKGYRIDKEDDFGNPVKVTTSEPLQDFDIVMVSPSVFIFVVVCGGLLYWNCRSVRTTKVKVIEVPPLEGSSEASLAQQNEFDEFNNTSFETELDFFDSNGNSRRKQKSYHHLRRNYRHRQQHLKEINSKTTPKSKYLLGRLWQYWSHPKKEWDPDHWYMKKYGVVVESFVPVYFFIIDCVVALVLSIAEGISLNCTKLSCCNSITGTCLVASLSHTLLLFKSSPLQTKLDVFSNYILSVMSLISSVLVIIEINLVAEGGDDIIEVLGLLNEFIMEAATVLAFFNIAMLYIPPVIVPFCSWVWEQLKENCSVFAEDSDDDKNKNTKDDEEMFLRASRENRPSKVNPGMQQDRRRPSSRNSALLSSMLLSPIRSTATANATTSTALPLTNSPRERLKNDRSASRTHRHHHHHHHHHREWRDSRQRHSSSPRDQERYTNNRKNHAARPSSRRRYNEEEDRIKNVKPYQKNEAYQKVLTKNQKRFADL